jgi:hypothetical protein
MRDRDALGRRFEVKCREEGRRWALGEWLREGVSAGFMFMGCIEEKAMESTTSGFDC